MSRLRIDARYPEESPEAYGVEYLHSDEISVRKGVGLAVSILFAPLGALRKGASLDEVNALIARADRVFTSYKTLAQAQCQQPTSPVQVAPIPPKNEPTESKCSDLIQPPNNPDSDNCEYIDDDEVL